MTRSELSWVLSNFRGAGQTHECHGGTAFYRHKESGLDGIHDLVKVNAFLQNSSMSWQELTDKLALDMRKPNKWIRTDFVQMKNNRLVTFNGRRFHSHVFDFKSVRPQACAVQARSSQRTG